MHLSFYDHTNDGSTGTKFIRDISPNLQPHFFLQTQIGRIALATTLVQRRVHNAPLCCKELRAVPVVEIEFAERLLMEGLNYEFHCFHAADIIEEILYKDNSRSPSCIIGDSDRLDISYRSAATTYSCNNSLYRGVDLKNDEQIGRAHV